MNVKISTKEKFHEVYVLESELSAIMAEDLRVLLTDLQKTPPGSLVLSLEEVSKMDEAAAMTILQCQQAFYDSSLSFVVCLLSESVEKFLDDHDWLEQMNVAPTLSEAWDIVQMEVIERELLDGFDE